MIKTLNVNLKRLPGSEDLPLPKPQSDGASGIDLHAAVSNPITLAPLERKLIRTGIAVAIPAGFEGQIRPRSGLAIKHGITLLNSPGTIDSDYRGEIQLIIVNLGQENFTIERGMRLAQMVIMGHVKPELEVVENLQDTVRSDSGFGHTGY